MDGCGVRFALESVHRFGLATQLGKTGQSPSQMDNKVPLSFDSLALQTLAKAARLWTWGQCTAWLVS